MRSAEEFEDVQRLIAAGLNDCAIARLTGIPRKTIWQWRRRPGVRPRYKTGSSSCGVAHDFNALPPAAYCYLLGLYLGDGYISRQPRTFHLRITCDTKYPAIINRRREAIDALFPLQRSGLVVRGHSKCADVSHCSKHWPCLFPQHGPGRKHHRRIALEPWQQTLVDQETAEFICGLIHSDGCRVVSIYRKADTARMDEFIGPKDRAVPLEHVHYTP